MKRSGSSCKLCSECRMPRPAVMNLMARTFPVAPLREAKTSEEPCSGRKAVFGRGGHRRCADQKHHSMCVRADQKHEAIRVCAQYESWVDSPHPRPVRSQFRAIESAQIVSSLGRAARNSTKQYTCNRSFSREDQACQANMNAF